MMEKDEDNFSKSIDHELSADTDKLSLDFGFTNANELICTLRAVGKYYEDGGKLEEEIVLGLRQCYKEKFLFTALVLKSFFRSQDEIRIKTQDFIKICLLDKIKSHKFMATPVPMEKFFTTLKKILAESYTPPGDIPSLIDDIRCVQFAYLCGATGVCIPSNESYKLDLRTFSLIYRLGLIQADSWSYPTKIKHKVNLRAGKEKQGSYTRGMILEAYKVLGAEWKDDEPQKLPILLGGVRISIDKLAGKIFKDPKVDVTQRHIYNYLKELHEKGEI